jgi:hypothetical protein
VVLIRNVLVQIRSESWICTLNYGSEFGSEYFSISFRGFLRYQKIKFSKFIFLLLTRVADRDPHDFNADPAPTFRLNADPDSAPHQSDANLRPWVSTLLQSASTNLFWASKAPEFTIYRRYLYNPHQSLQIQIESKTQYWRNKICEINFVSTDFSPKSQHFR